jgi:hypothetical protein
MRDISLLIYGDPKWGKSSFCSNAEGALFIATEPGLNHLDVFQMGVKPEGNVAKVRGPDGDPVEKTMSGWEYIEYIYKLLVHKEHEFKTVIFDTIDVAYDYCSAHVSAENGWKSPAMDGEGAPLEWGIGWVAVNLAFEELLRKFHHLDVGLFFVSHAKIEKIDTRTVGNKATPTLKPGARKVVLKMCDVILYATSDADGRALFTKQEQTHDAGDRTNRLPESIRISDSDPRLGAVYKSFAHAIGGNNETK